MPPPYYCGRQLRQKKEDFSLPFDLWWQHVNKQLPGRDIAATWNYKRIKTNVYIDVPKAVAKGYEMQACQCQLPSSDQMPGMYTRSHIDAHSSYGLLHKHPWQ